VSGFLTRAPPRRCPSAPQASYDRKSSGRDHHASRDERYGHRRQFRAWQSMRTASICSRRELEELSPRLRRGLSPPPVSEGRAALASAVHAGTNRVLPAACVTTSPSFPVEGTPRTSACRHSLLSARFEPMPARTSIDGLLCPTRSYRTRTPCWRALIPMSLTSESCRPPPLRLSTATTTRLTATPDPRQTRRCPKLRAGLNESMRTRSRAHCSRRALTPLYISQRATAASAGFRAHAQEGSLSGRARAHRASGTDEHQRR